ncbi:MAG: hypothetical protein IJI67_08585 [Clostridia bacterium]|nr:hypothetical protein [Clostridia bacterium]
MNLKKLMALCLLSVLLAAGGCSAAKQPKAFVLPQCMAGIVFGENQFDAVLDFAPKEKSIVLKAKENAFDTRYTFTKSGVTLQYDSIKTSLDLDALPDTNTAALIYRAITALESGKVSWEKQESSFIFYGKIGGVAFSGSCDSGGNLLSLEVPQYRFYLKTILSSAGSD